MIGRRWLWFSASLVGAVLTVALFGWWPARVAEAVGPNLLNATAALVNAAQGDAAAVVRQGCRYDTTPEVVADGDVHAVRCDANGDQFVNIATTALTEVQGDQVVPQAPATVACTDTGLIAFTADAADVRLEIWNTSASDVCIRWCAGACAGGAPDRTTLTTCSVVLGAYAGSGTPDVYVTPADFRVGGEAFECDTVAAPGNLVVTAHRTQ